MQEALGKFDHNSKCNLYIAYQVITGTLGALQPFDLIVTLNEVWIPGIHAPYQHSPSIGNAEKGHNPEVSISANLLHSALSAGQLVPRLK